MIEKHHSLSDEQFKTQFDACTLDPELFSHEAHIRLAWLHLMECNISEAIINIKRQLKAFVKHVGAEDKYHETLTIASLKIVNHFVEQSETTTFPSFINEFPRLLTHFKELVEAHYSRNILDSSQARQNYLEPDLLRF